jgi:hypothetical protein
VIRRDGFRCRACGANSRLLVHHRATNSEERSLITLCVRCHIRVHRWRWFRYRVSSTLVQLWTELHAGAPLQLQFPLGTPAQTESQRGKPKEEQPEQGEPSQPNLALSEKPSEQLFGCAESLVSQDDRLGLTDGV